MTNKPTEFEGGLNKPTQLPSDPEKPHIENPIVKPDEPDIKPPVNSGGRPSNPIVEPPKPSIPTKPTPPPVATQLPTDTPRIAKMKELSQKLADILAQNGGAESNIPITHNEYWSLKAEMNAVRNESTS